MDVDTYLSRLGYRRAVRPDLATLRALHRAHLRAIPWENLDLQLQRPVTLDPAIAFDKLVVRGRGGWCYEMNGVFGAVLSAIGFSVTTLTSAVRRGERGDDSVGNHVALRVDLDRPYLADVGFAEGLLEPVPLAPGTYRQAGRHFRLEQTGPWWGLHNQRAAGPPCFEFTMETADPERLAVASDWLQTSPDSVLAQTAVCQRHTASGMNILVGRMHCRVRSGRRTLTLLQSEQELARVLVDDFDLTLPAPDGERLWDRICRRHEERLMPRAEDASRG